MPSVQGTVPTVQAVPVAAPGSTQGGIADGSAAGRFATLIPQVDPERFKQLMGDTTEKVADRQWFTWPRNNNGESQKNNPFPKWDGKDPARRLKAWLKDLKMWRRTTDIPADRHGLEMWKSFDPMSVGPAPRT